MNTTFNPLPTLTQQFVSDFYEPMRKEIPANMPTVFDLAKEKYEREHKHQFPYSYDTFMRKFYGG